jgi:hypothetical protein
MEQPCAIHGRITEVHKAFPNSTLLNSPCFSRILTIPFSLFSLFSKNIKEWPYFDYIRSLFESVGLDNFINGSFNKGTFYTFFGEFTRKQLVLARSLSLEPRKSFILIKYFWVLPVILNVLYKCKLDFVSILSCASKHLMNYLVNI